MPTKTDRIRFVCEHCDYRARIPAKYDGQTIACPNCKKPSVAKSDEGPSTGHTVEIRKEEAQPADDKFRFVCGDCGYRARIPVKYAGMAIKCPGCGKPQEANRGQEDEHTGGTVEIRKVDLTAGGSRFLFQCGGCGYRARLPSKYHGQDIKCPGCGTPQTAVAADPGPSTGSTVDISKVEAAAMTEEPSPSGGLSLDEPSPSAIDLDAPGADHVEVPVAAPVRTATPIASPVAQSSDDLALPVEEVETEAEAPAAPAKPYDPFGDQARDRPEAQAPMDSDAQNLLGELRSGSGRMKAEAQAPAKPQPEAKTKAKPAAPAPAKPAARATAPQSEARRGSDQLPSAAKKGPVMALGTLLALAVIAAGVLGWLWSQTAGELAAEQAAHQGTSRQLSDEQGAHQVTRDQLAAEQSGHGATKGRLETAETRVEELEQNLLETKAALNIANDQLGQAKQQAGELRKQVDAAVLDKREIERQLETLSAQMTQVTETMQKAGHETLEAFLDDALKRRR